MNTSDNNEENIEQVTPCAPSPAPVPTNSIVIKAVSLHDDFKVHDSTDNSIEISIMNSHGHYSVIL